MRYHEPRDGMTYAQDERNAPNRGAKQHRVDSSRQRRAVQRQLQQGLNPEPLRYQPGPTQKAQNLAEEFPEVPARGGRCTEAWTLEVHDPCLACEPPCHVVARRPVFRRPVVAEVEDGRQRGLRGEAAKAEPARRSPLGQDGLSLGQSSARGDRTLANVAIIETMVEILVLRHNLLEVELGLDPAAARLAHFATQGRVLDQGHHRFCKLMG